MKLETSKSVILAIQNLPPKEQKEVFSWVRLQKPKLIKNKVDEESAFWLNASGESLKQIWGTPQEDIWDELFKNENK
jgi:hypothetical protein